MDFMDISRKRHTVRKYAQTPVEQEKIEKILEAGRWAPTAVNAQPQRILVLDTPENLDKVKEFCTSRLALHFTQYPSIFPPYYC